MNIYLGENIKKLRKEKDLTQEKLADLIGVSFQAISKWEREESLPDVAILPVIADFFDCTIDDLFGVDKAKNEQKISEYLELYSKECSKNRELTFKKFQQAVKEFPNDFRILVRYMELLKEENSNPLSPEYEKASNELMSIYEKIQNNCTDDYIRIWSKRIICDHLIVKYDCLGFDEKYYQKAKDIICSLPAMRDTREYLSMYFSKDTSKWHESHEDAIEELLYLLQNTIIGYCYYDDSFSPRYKINVIKHMNELFKIVDGDNKYSKNRIHIIYNCGHLGHLHYEIGDKESAIKYLRIAAEYAKDLDNHTEVMEKIARFYEKEKQILPLSMCARMTKLMLFHYHLPDDFKATPEFREVLKIME